MMIALIIFGIRFTFLLCLATLMYCYIPDYQVPVFRRSTATINVNDSADIAKQVAMKIKPLVYVMVQSRNAPITTGHMVTANACTKACKPKALLKCSTPTRST